GAVIDENVGLQAAHHFVHLFGFPTGGRQGPIHVVPEDVQFAVVRANLANLAVDVIDKAATGGFIGKAASAVRMMPVHQRVIESEPHTFGAGGIGVLGNQIAAGGLLGSAI